LFVGNDMLAKDNEFKDVAPLSARQCAAIHKANEYGMEVKLLTKYVSYGPFIGLVEKKYIEEQLKDAKHVEIERESYESSQKRKLIYGNDGFLYQLDDDGKLQLANSLGLHLMVMSPDASIYTAKDNSGDRKLNPTKNKIFSHASFNTNVNGDQIYLFAGKIRIIDGKITNITPDSGHLKPGNHNLYKAVEILKPYISSNANVAALSSEQNNLWDVRDLNIINLDLDAFLKKYKEPAIKAWEEIHNRLSPELKVNKINN